MLSREQIRTPVWPYVAVVTCLFLLSVLASRTWHTSTQSEPPPITTRTTQSLLRPDPRLEKHPISIDRPEFNFADGSPELALTSPANQPEVSSNHFVNETKSVFGSDSPRQVAPVAPAVGEHITLDISVKESPALPSEEMDLGLQLQEPSLQLQEPSVAAVEPMPEEPEHTPVKLERSPVEDMPAIASVFPYSPELVAEFQKLMEVPQCRAWAQQGLDLLERLHQSPSFVSVDSTNLLQQLTQHAQQANQLAQNAEPLALRANILRVGYAVQRRSDVWKQVKKIIANGADKPNAAVSVNMAPALAAVETRLKEASYSIQWRDYLLLDDVKKLVREGSAEARRELAKRALKRIESPQLTDRQAEVFRNAPFDAYTRELRQWASEPVDYRKLLDDIEIYERSRSTTDAIAVARSYDALRWSTNPDVASLAEKLNVHYRNSNLRVAMTAEFLNRLLPDPQQFDESIAENISGANVYGTSRTLNQLRVVLVPDGTSWRIGLEAHGEVASDTSASKGPATFYNQGFARYYARKLLLVDRRGIRVWRAEAVANSDTQLTGFETDYDALPVIGWFARSMARQQHDEKYHEAKAEAEAKLENRATSRFDEEVHARLSAAEKELNQKLIQPFERIDLKPTPLDLRTTEQRIIARYRLASDLQLGAHSPRPQAPGNSLISVQVHESAINNMLENLKLEGKRSDLHELYRELARTFERQDSEVPEDIPDNVTIEFADEEAVRVQCDDGRVTLTIRIAELKSGRDRKRNFAVRAYYVPDSNQLHANLVRDGVIELMGESLGDRLSLRLIFNKVLSKSRSFNIVNKKLAENPRLKDVHVNQFVINDGWIGVAMGPSSAGGLEHLAKEKGNENQQR